MPGFKQLDEVLQDELWDLERLVKKALREGRKEQVKVRVRVRWYLAYNFGIVLVLALLGAGYVAYVDRSFLGALSATVIGSWLGLCFLDSGPRCKRCGK